MKKLILTLSVAVASYFSYAQNSNPWPTSGNVGIGTTTPASLLHLYSTATTALTVEGATNNTAYGRINLVGRPSASGHSVGYLQVNSTRGGQAATGVAAIDFAKDGGGSDDKTFMSFSTHNGASLGERVRISNEGNVGIGTTSPGAPLHVYGTHPSNTKTMQIGAGTSAAGRFYKADGLDVIDGPLYLQGNYNQNVLMGLGGGNVGIGTATPATKLHVAGGEITLDSGNAINFNGTVSGATPYIYYNSGSNDLLLRNNVSGGTMTLGATMEAIRILSSGNVGIGTTIPDEKLTVKGKIHSQEVIVDAMTTVPDYVFEPDYKLPSLDELKAYVDQNHHLPEIPSAKEIEKNGIQLGDMNMKLLKKIEELTLYIIEQNKQLSDQQKINQSLQSQINQLKNK